jgi:hypothetical protein
VIVCASILLAIRHLQLGIPSDPTISPGWWDLFDAPFDDVWIVAGLIMRLYRSRSPLEHSRVAHLLSKKDVRRWLDEKE